MRKRVFGEFCTLPLRGGVVATSFYSSRLPLSNWGTPGEGSPVPNSPPDCFGLPSCALFEKDSAPAGAAGAPPHVPASLLKMYDIKGENHT